MIEYRVVVEPFYDELRYAVRLVAASSGGELEVIEEPDGVRGYSTDDLRQRLEQRLEALKKPTLSWTPARLRENPPA